MKVAVVGTYYKTLKDADTALIEVNKQDEFVIVKIEKGFLVVNKKQLPKYESYSEQLSIFRNDA